MVKVHIIFRQVNDCSLGVAIWALLLPIPHSPPTAKDLKELTQKANNIFLDLFYSLFTWTFIIGAQALRFIIDSASWFENDTENTADKVSSMLYNTGCIKTLLRKSKVRIGQCMNANDSYPVGVLSKFTPPSCKITTKDKQRFSWRKWFACYFVLNGKVLNDLRKVLSQLLMIQIRYTASQEALEHFRIHSYFPWWE